jgi:L-lysine 2,3-aminomutase
MKTLLYGLQKISVRPYYLFQCDPVAGTGHFHVPVARGIQLIDRLRQTMSGLCLPQYVIDMPGQQAKVPLGTVHDGAWDSHCIPDRYRIKSVHSFTTEGDPSCIQQVISEKA